MLAEQDDYIIHWHEHDVRRQLFMQLPARTAVACNLYFDEHYVKKSALYQEYLIPNEWRFAAGIKFIVGDSEAYLAVHRNLRQGPYETTDLNVLREVAPHFERAIRLNKRFMSLHALTGALEASLGRLHAAAFVSDGQGKVLALNHDAEEIIKKGEYLTIKSGRLTVITGGATQELSRLLIAATTPPVKGGFVRLSGQPTPDACALEIAPLPASAPLCQMWQIPLALVLVIDAKQRPVPHGRQLIDLFGLTSAEARLAVELAEGKRLRDITDTRKVTDATLRSQMRALFAKTGTSRQSELISFLSRMPARTIRSPSK